jgi:polysaccharide export outer membrane protein
MPAFQAMTGEKLMFKTAVLLTATFMLAMPGWGQQGSSSPVDSRSVNNFLLGANLPAQKVGPNDLIGISIYDAPEFTHTVRVGLDGCIRLPMLKQRVKVEGLYPNEIEKVIADTLEKAEILVEPIVTVTVAEYGSRPISIVGAVKNPLVFQADRPTTLLEALSHAGGLREDAGPEILLTTKQTNADGTATGLTRRIPVRGLIDAADPTLNVMLVGGEEIRVPEAPKIFVFGNVKHPGAFPVQGKGEMTILRTLALAEGLSDFASKDAYIYRGEAAGVKSEIPISLARILKREIPDVTLEPNDLLYIPDNKGGRIRATLLDKILTFASTAGASALVYGLVRP